MQCIRCRRLLTKYLDMYPASMSAQQWQRVVEHVQGCPECAEHALGEGTIESR